MRPASAVAAKRAAVEKSVVSFMAQRMYKSKCVEVMYEGGWAPDRIYVESD
jgi:hypothetical protein